MDRESNNRIIGILYRQRRILKGKGGVCMQGRKGFP